MAFTGWLERTALSIWVRESPSLFAFPLLLIVHAWGMGLLAGANAAVGLRVLGFAARVPLDALGKFYPFLWFGFAINTLSGILLLVGYPTKALTNPLFYVKLGCVAVGMVVMVRLRGRVIRNTPASVTDGRFMAGLSIVAWAGAVFAGRFLAYTCSWLMVDFPC